MAFDVESGASGAAAGSAFGPIGTGAGFVIGGFLGGRAKKKAKREQRQRQAEIRRISSPENYLATIKRLTPQFRAQVASTIAPALQGGVASTLARRNLTGTGVGEAVRNLSQVVPGVEASRLATQTAGDLINRQLAALTGERNVQSGQGPLSMDQGIQLAQVAALFRSLRGGATPGSVQAQPYTFGSTDGVPDYYRRLPPSAEPPLFPNIQSVR